MSLTTQMKGRAARWLATCARLVISARRPIIVAVTGSVGKSSAKEAIALVLAQGYRVVSSPGNFNNEFGLPAAILGVTNPGYSPLAWCRVIGRTLRLVSRLGEYPEVLVLEMGIDRPGDMDYLLSIAQPQIAVLTRIAASHLAYFENLGQIAKEKGKLIAAVPEDGYAIANADDERVMKQTERTKATVISYGLHAAATLTADNIRLVQEGGRVEGLSLKLNHGGKTIPVRLPHIIARHQLSAVLAAAAVGTALHINLVDIASALMAFRSLPGRMNLLYGTTDIRIIDDTYNASAVSVEAALGTLRELIAPRKVIVLGDMLELGSESDTVHRSLRDTVLGSGASVFVGVGQHMHFLVDALRQTNFPEKGIHHFPDPVTAADRITTITRPGDLVLVKGSQGLRMEFVVERLLGASDDEERPIRLCRQSFHWRNTPFVVPEEWH